MEFNMFTLAYKKPIKSIIYDGMTVGYSFSSESNAGFPISAEFSPDDLSKINTLDCIYYSVFNYDDGSPFSSPAKVYYDAEESRWVLLITNTYTNTEELYASTHTTKIADISKTDWYYLQAPYSFSMGFAAKIARSGTNYLKLSNTNTDADGFYLTPEYYNGAYMCSIGIDKPNYVQLTREEKAKIFVLDRDSNQIVKYFESEDLISFDNMPGYGGEGQAENLLLSNTIKWIPVDGTPATAENQPKFELLTVK
jgi:hypothetical protein